MSCNILIVGAGRIGKGFLGEVFEAAEWNVSFLDHDPNITKQLRTQPYHVTCYGTNATVQRTVTNYAVYDCDPELTCLPEVLNADLIALCIYPENISEAADYLGPMIAQRAENDGKKLSILCCTNQNHIIPKVQSQFEKALGNEKAKKWFHKNVALRDVIIRRSTDYIDHNPVNLVSTATMSLLIQPPLFVDLSDVPWMELQDRLEDLKEIKLYTYNSPHAACAYAGYLKGYKTINEAEADPEIADLMYRVLTEAVHGVSKEFRMDEQKVWDFCTLPKTKELMTDSIFRVAKDPQRKLSLQDRLTGNALFCMKHGFDPSALIQSIANGMAYDEPNDESAMEIQRLIRQKGIVGATSIVIGLPATHELVQRVAAVYQKIKHHKKMNRTEEET